MTHKACGHSPLNANKLAQVTQGDPSYLGSFQVGSPQPTIPLSKSKLLGGFNNLSLCIGIWKGFFGYCEFANVWLAEIALPIRSLCPVVLATAQCPRWEFYQPCKHFISELRYVCRSSDRPELSPIFARIHMQSYVHCTLIFVKSNWISKNRVQLLQPEGAEQHVYFLAGCHAPKHLGMSGIRMCLG